VGRHHESTTHTAAHTHHASCDVLRFSHVLKGWALRTADRARQGVLVVTSDHHKWSSCRWFHRFRLRDAEEGACLALALLASSPSEVAPLSSCRLAPRGEPSAIAWRSRVRICAPWSMRVSLKSSSKEKELDCALMHGTQRMQQEARLEKRLRYVQPQRMTMSSGA